MNCEGQDQNLKESNELFEFYWNSFYDLNNERIKQCIKNKKCEDEKCIKNKKCKCEKSFSIDIFIKFLLKTNRYNMVNIEKKYKKYFFFVDKEKLNNDTDYIKLKEEKNKMLNAPILLLTQFTVNKLLLLGYNCYYKCDFQYDMEMKIDMEIMRTDILGYEILPRIEFQ